MTFRMTISAAALLCALSFSSTVAAGSGEPRDNRFWWPEQLDLSALRDHDRRSNPLGDDFDYAQAFAALDLDALAHTHPIYTTVRTPDEANENFDVITYEKGASVVRMRTAKGRRGSSLNRSTVTAWPAYTVSATADISARIASNVSG